MPLTPVLLCVLQQRLLPGSLDELRGLPRRRLMSTLTCFTSELITSDGEHPLTPAQRLLLTDLARIYLYLASAPPESPQVAQYWEEFTELLSYVTSTSRAHLEAQWGLNAQFTVLSNWGYNVLPVSNDSSLPPPPPCS